MTTTRIHQRKIIRYAVVAALTVGSPSWGTRVFPTRMIPWRKQHLPAVAVYTQRETSQDLETAPREYKRSLVLAVEAVVQQLDNVDDQLDAIALELESAMDADWRFGSTCANSSLTGTELDVGVQGDMPVGFLRLSYTFEYFTDAPDAADQELDDLETIDAKTTITGGTGTPPVEDRVTFAPPETPP